MELMVSWILKDGNSVTDQSGNDNDFTTSGTLTQTEDCPSNVFCTMNPLASESGIHFYKWKYDCRNFSTDGASCGRYFSSATSGKYYWECKYSNTGNYGVGL